MSCSDAIHCLESLKLILLARFHAAQQPFITINTLSEAEQFKFGHQQHQAEEADLLLRYPYTDQLYHTVVAILR